MLLVTWDPPDDLGGRSEVMYRTRCDEQQRQDTPGRWLPCGSQVAVLPNWAGLNSTRVAITGLNPQHDYRLMVQACNDISPLLGAAGAASSTANIAVHRCEYCGQDEAPGLQP